MEGLSMRGRYPFMDRESPCRARSRPQSAVRPQSRAICAVLGWGRDGDGGWTVPGSGGGATAGDIVAGAVGVQRTDPADDGVEILLRKGSDLQVIDLDQVVLLRRTDLLVVDSLAVHPISLYTPRATDAKE